MGIPAVAAAAAKSKVGRAAAQQMLSRRKKDDDDGGGKGKWIAVIAILIAIPGLIVSMMFYSLFAYKVSACNGGSGNSANTNAGGSTGALLAAKAAVAAGFRGQLLVTMVAVAGAESRWASGPDYNGICCYGMWQLNANHGYSIADMADPFKNAQEAMSVYRGQGLNYISWQTYGGGGYPPLYQGFMGTATNVVNQLQSSGGIPSVGCTLSTISSTPVGNRCEGGVGSASSNPFSNPFAPIAGGSATGTTGTATGGQAMQVTASVFNDAQGYKNDILAQHPDSYAELSKNPAAKDFSAMGNLPYMTPVTVTFNGKSMTLYKRDVGAGGAGINGTPRAIDIYQTAAQKLGISGLAVVTVTIGQGGAASSTGSCDNSPQVDAAGYVNPFAHTQGIQPQRIDMGVDYDGTGEIDAFGKAKITFAGTNIGGGWTCNGTNDGVVYQLLDGADAGRFVYVTEGAIPAVSVGQTVQAGQKIADFPSGGCIEIGWSTTGAGASPEAASLGQIPSAGDAGNNRTFCGQMMSDLLHATGAPAGLANQPPSGNSCPPITH